MGPFVLTLNATDPEGDVITYSMAGSIAARSTLDAASGLFQWTPSSYETSDLKFFATDSNDATSSLNVITEVCGCENGGECDYSTLVIDKSFFKLASCNCPVEF